MAQLAHFPFVESQLDLNQKPFQENQKAWSQFMEEFANNLNEARSEGTAHSMGRHEARGQLLARDRIALLLDSDSPFLELGTFTGFGLEDSSPCASILAGIGIVSGRVCMVLSHSPAVSGGAWNELTVQKQNRITEIANEAGDLPLVALVQSAGVFLPQQFRVFHKGGQIFRDLSIRTANQQPSCAVVFGSSTAGGAYHPGVSDHTIFVENQAQVFLAGPPLVKMATGELIDPEKLGGARVHGTITGLADQIASDEFDAIRKAREWVSTLKQRNPPVRSIRPPLAPRYPIEDIFSIVNPDVRKPFDMKEVLIRLVDDSRFSVFKPEYGPNLITAFAHIKGIPLAIIANQTPIINPDEASKGATFIRICNQQNLPIVFLHNVTGFMVGSKAEHAAIIKKGAQFVSAVSVSKVPHISVILGASYGAGNYAMCGRSYRPRFMFTWPSGRCSVMGPDQLAGVMAQVESNSAKNKGVELKAEDVEARIQRLRSEVERDSSAYKTSAHLLDDGIIDPRDTREVLGMALEVCQSPPIEGNPGHRALARI